MEFSNLVIRPINSKDINTLLKVAKNVGPGFTSLPQNEEFLTKKIKWSEDSFNGNIDHREGLYLLIMESLTGDFIGMCGIDSQIGNKVPFFNYKISTITQVCKDLDKYLEHKILQLVNDFQGASELVSLFLHPKYRGGRRGELLSRCRLLLMAQCKEWFDTQVIAEIRGISDDKGNSPLWDSLGVHFFDTDFLTADYYTTVYGKQFISDLMPSNPIYIEMLPKDAQAVLGLPHKDAAPAKSLLEKEGFEYSGYVDIFDGGPLISAKVDNLRTVIECQVTTINRIEKNIEHPMQVMACNNDVEFKLCVGNIEMDNEGGIKIDSTIADRLKVTTGQQLRFCPF